MKKHNLNLIKDFLFKAVQEAGFDVDPDQLHLEKTKTLKHGHFSTNVAMLLAGKSGKRPHDVAQAVIEKLDSKLASGSILLV